jgi:hypothetical protein
MVKLPATFVSGGQLETVESYSHAAEFNGDQMTYLGVERARDNVHSANEGEVCARIMRIEEWSMVTTDLAH